MHNMFHVRVSKTTSKHINPPEWKVTIKYLGKQQTEFGWLSGSTKTLKEWFQVPSKEWEHVNLVDKWVRTFEEVWSILQEHEVPQEGLEEVTKKFV